MFDNNKQCLFDGGCFDRLKRGEKHQVMGGKQLGYVSIILQHK
ncbi:MAG: hypothetical protein AAF960_23710 [Bacteroidota bacterium]